MTIKKAILPLLFLSISTSITAGVVVESTYKMTGINVQGHVIDSKTKEYVPYVLVAVKGTTLATTTDAKGFYSIKNIPQGKVILEVKHLGYHNASVTLKTDKEETLEQNFELTDDVLSLDEVVLTANRQQTLRREAPVLVNVVDKRLFNLTNSATLSQGLNFQPGVRTENNCQNCGFSQVRINGLDGHYSQILIDSRPVFSALNGVYGLEQIPSSMIERVEVVRGGGSSLYGASAIGGTINVITKEPIRNSAEVGHTLSSYGNHSGWENTTNLNASIVTEDAKGGLFIYGNHHYRPGYDHNNDGYTELPNLKNQTLGFSAFYKFTPYSRITLRYHNLAEFRRGGNHLERAPHESDITEQLEHDVNGGSLAYDLFSKDTKRQLKLYYSFENTARKSYYGGIAGSTEAADTIKSAKAYGRTKEINHLLGVQYVHSFDKCWFMPATLTAGLEYNNDKMNDEVLGYDHYLKQRVSIGSAYFQNEWKDSRFTFLLGARLDKH
ncbi:TonB-dependent receptor, partial [Hoylesella nanceiensis]|uniref:TonB-dependent receptor n=1 Tax=Hoylesella nanceiensis TaxID=425941 RepID=UPI00242D3FD0